MYKTVKDSVNSDLVKRSRSQIKVKRFGFSGAVFINRSVQTTYGYIEHILKDIGSGVSLLEVIIGIRLQY